MQKFFQVVGFLAGLFVFGVGISALFKGIGGSSGGSFKMDDIIEFKGDSTAIVFVLAGVFLMVAAAGWFRNMQKADSEQAKKFAVARDLRNYVRASERLARLTVGLQIQSLKPDAMQDLVASPPPISPESDAVLQELENRGA